MKSTQNYIPEIDTLRAIAVSFVLLFHAFPDFAPNGFLGVDIFLVISGFVIGRTYLTSLVEGHVRLTDFYVARIRRLTPALAVTVAATSIAAHLILSPRDVEAFARSLICQPFYIQNIYYWIEGDYFTLPLRKPLLHTWSLAIEEQFYLFFGFLVLFCRRHSAALMKHMIIILTALSLAMYFGITLKNISPRTAFYLLPTRLWEFGFGIIAFLTSSRLPAITNGRWVIYLANVSLLLVIFIPAAEIIIPPFQTFATCTLTALILAWLNKIQQPLPLMRVAAVRYIGRISYPLYLWHWPLISIPSIWSGRSLTPAEASVSLGASFALAALTNAFIERPVRSRRIMSKPRDLILGAGACALVIISVASLYIGTNGATYRYPLAVRYLFDASHDKRTARCPLIFGVLHPFTPICPICESPNKAGVLLLGDSHADQILPQLTALAKKYNVSLYFENSSRCMLGHAGPNQWCTEAAFKKIILEARLKNVHEVVSVSIWGADSAETKSVFTNNTDFVISQGMHVTILEQVPHDIDLDPTLRAERSLRDRRLSLEGIPVRIHQQQMEQTRAFFHQLSEPRASMVDIIDSTPGLCDAEFCAFHTGGKPNYFDDNHLTQIGVRRIIPLFDPLFRRLTSGRDTNN